MIPFHLLSKSGKRKRLKDCTENVPEDKKKKIHTNIDASTDLSKDLRNEKTLNHHSSTSESFIQDDSDNELGNNLGNNIAPTRTTSNLSSSDTHNELNISLESNSNSAVSTALSIEDEGFPTFYGSSDESDEEEFFENQSVESNSVSVQVKQFLHDWSLQNNITHSALGSLCKGLKTIFSKDLDNLPLDPRTILQTPTSSSMNQLPIGNGHYIHIGFKIQLNFIASIVQEPLSTLSLIFNVDGLPLFNNSTAGELWPILMATPCVINLSHKVFPIGFYFGVGKPADLELYFSQFLEELQDVLANGFVFNNRKINVNILGFSCDVPARSYIMGTVGHTGFFSCFRCTVKGKTVEHRRVFTKLDCPLRSDEEFRNRTDTNFQPIDRNTPLMNLTPSKLNFISDFILEPMHLIDLGVMKSLLQIWNSGGIPLQLSANQRALISEDLLRLRKCIPLEFARIPREFKIVGRWKATECRMFLLYLGIVVLKDRLTDDKYKHFISLHLAISIISQPLLCSSKENRSYARQLLIYFVSKVPDLYAEHLVTHNFHSLIHLVDDMDHFVDLIPNFSMSDVSSYRFENFLYSCKKLVRGKSKPLAQIGRRIGELFQSEVLRNKYTSTMSSGINLLLPHKNGPLLALTCGPEYGAIQTSNFKLTVNSPNNCCRMKNGDIVLIENIAFSKELKKHVIIGKKFLALSDFYSFGDCPSSLLGIYKAKKLSDRVMMCVNEIKLKCVCLSYKDSCVIIPLLHSEISVSKFDF